MPDVRAHKFVHRYAKRELLRAVTCFLLPRLNARRPELVQLRGHSAIVRDVIAVLYHAVPRQYCAWGLRLHTLQVLLRTAALLRCKIAVPFSITLL